MKSPFATLLNQFLRNALLLVVLNLLVKGAYLLGVERAVQNILPLGDYGLYFSLLNFSLLLQLVLDFGLQLYNSRNLAGNRNILQKYFPHFLGLKLVLAVVFLLSLLLAGWWIGYDAEVLPLLAIIGGNQVMMSMLLFLRSNLTGLGRYRADSWISVVDKSLMLLLVGGLLLFARGSLTVYSFALAQSLSWAISLGLVSAILWRNLDSFRPRLQWRMALVLLRRAAPFALAVFLMTAYTRTDAVMIERLLADGKVRVDHYAAAYRLLDAANMIGYLLSGLLLPMFARLLARREAVDGLLRLALPTVLAGSFCLVVPVAVYAPEIVELLYPEFADERTGKILRLLIFSFVAMAVNYVYGALLGAADELRRMNYIFAVGCVLNVVGNLLVVRTYGAIGVAAVTTITQSFISLAQAFLAHRQLSLVGVFPRPRALVTFCGGFGLLTWLVYWWLPAPWLLQFFVVGSGGGLLAFVTGLLSFSEWQALVKKQA